MEIKNKIQKIGFLSGTFNAIKEDIPKQSKKKKTNSKMLSWRDILPMGCTTEKFTKFEPYKVEREQHICVIQLSTLVD